MKVHLGGQKFQTDDELQCRFLNWIYMQDKIVYAAGISNLPAQCKKCVTVKGEYLEKELGFGDSGMYNLTVKN
jgi:hypothetical protein